MRVPLLLHTLHVTGEHGPPHPLTHGLRPAERFPMAGRWLLQKQPGRS